MLTTTTRRLIGPDELSAKIGYSRDWLYRNRPRLEALGFPAPVLGGDGAPGKSSGPLRWDERAIDLWLDAKMPEELRRHANDERINITAIDTAAAQARLSQRAKDLAL